MAEDAYERGDSVDACTTPHPNRTRYFRAILTDAQIKALEEAAKNSDHLTGEHGAAPDPVLHSAVVALQTAEILIP